MPKKSTTPKAPGKRGAKSKGPQTVPLREVPLLGREEEQRQLLRTMGNGFPQAMLLTGAPGVGKFRLALWAAQSLLCSESTSQGACGTCNDCRLSSTLNHPDLHIFLPHTTLGGGSVDAQVDKAEEMRYELLAQRRENAFYDAAPSGSMYYVATVRLLQRKVYQTAFREGGRKVFLLADVDRLTPYEGASEAANSLLKVLEEPPAGTHFLLTSSAAYRVLPTIRSRAAEFHVGRLADEAVREILQRALAQPESPEMEAAIANAGGSLSGARNYLNEEWRARRDHAVQILEVALSGKPRQRYALVQKQGFGGARTDFYAQVALVRDLCHQAAKRQVSHGERIDPELEALLEKRGAPQGAEHWARAIRACLLALRQAQGNVNPQLILHRLLLHLEQSLA